MSNNGWIGIDLDGTLAKYDGWQGATNIGEPVPLMAERVRNWLAKGQPIKILTARVSSNNPSRVEAQKTIDEWCLKHFGVLIPTTSEKDYFMVEMWDDRCIQVVPNTGVPISEYLMKEREK